MERAIKQEHGADRSMKKRAVSDSTRTSKRTKLAVDVSSPALNQSLTSDAPPDVPAFGGHSHISTSYPTLEDTADKPLTFVPSKSPPRADLPVTVVPTEQPTHAEPSPTLNVAACNSTDDSIAAPLPPASPAATGMNEDDAWWINAMPELEALEKAFILSLQQNTCGSTRPRN